MTKMFGRRSTTENVLEGLDLSGQRMLVTGVSAGLGVETARALVAHGARVVGASRDLDKAERAMEGVCKRGAHGGGLELVELDLASLTSVRDCADALVAAAEPFDLIIGNAGVMCTPFGRTVDGFETQFGTNHLGHFVLINRIAALLNPGGRFVSLSSGAHRRADVDLYDPGFERTEYDPHIAYGRSKTANALFAVEFDRRHRPRGRRATAVHPGVVQTDLLRHMTIEARQAFWDRAKSSAQGSVAANGLKSISQGAATSLWAGIVADAEAVGGRYCENCNVAEIVANDPNIRGGVRSYALEPERAKALWALSETMVGEKF